MYGKDIARFTTTEDFWNPKDAYANRPSGEHTTKVLILFVCWCSVMELLLDIPVLSGDTELITVFATRLMLLAIGLAAVVDTRFARPAFLLFCGASLIANAPRLPMVFNASFENSLIALAHCIGETTLVILTCIQSIRQMDAIQSKGSPSVLRCGAGLHDVSMGSVR